MQPTEHDVENDLDPASGLGAPELRVFSYAVSEKSDLYVAILEVLLAAKERFRLQVRPSEVWRALQMVREADGDQDQVGDEVEASSGAETSHDRLSSPGSTEDEVATALERLEAWGNLARFYDTVAPETLDQFYKKRFLYQLTPAGTAAHAGIRAVRAIGLDAGGRLSGVLLPGILERLEAIRAEVDRPDPSRLYSLLVDLFGSFEELAENAGRYMSDLAIETSVIAADDESFLWYKRAVFRYLDEFVGRLAEMVPRAALLVHDLEPHIDRVLGLAASVDLAPVREGEDEGPLRSFEVRWMGLRQWFVDDGELQSVAAALRLAMIDALNRILMAVGRLNERHLRRVSREADFMRLAQWFAESDRGESAALWDVAFGLYPSRHFSHSSGDEDLDRGKSFWRVTPTEIEPRLRATGSRGAAGRAGRRADYSAAKNARIAAVREQHRQARLAALRLAGRTPARLSDLGALDHEEFAQFLEVVDAALGSRPRADGSRLASTPLVRIILRPVPGAPPAQVRTARGILSGPDHELVLELGQVALEQVTG